MSRLLPSNEVLTVTYVAVLKIIAAELDHPLGAVHIGKRTSGPAVFHEGAQGNNGTRCVCDLWSPNWQEC